jgi:hypothetical protein
MVAATGRFFEQIEYFRFVLLGTAGKFANDKRITGDAGPIEYPVKANSPAPGLLQPNRDVNEDHMSVPLFFGEELSANPFLFRPTLH